MDGVGEPAHFTQSATVIDLQRYFHFTRIIITLNATGLFAALGQESRLSIVRMLVEVPVMLLVVRVVNASKGWYERGQA